MTQEQSKAREEMLADLREWAKKVTRMCFALGIYDPPPSKRWCEVAELLNAQRWN
jgi:hypothetical protein